MLLFSPVYFCLCVMWKSISANCDVKLELREFTKTQALLVIQLQLKRLGFPSQHVVLITALTLN